MGLPGIVSWPSQHQRVHRNWVDEIHGVLTCRMSRKKVTRSEVTQQSRGSNVFWLGKHGARNMYCSSRQETCPIPDHPGMVYVSSFVGSLMIHISRSQHRKSRVFPSNFPPETENLQGLNPCVLEHVTWCDASAHLAAGQGAGWSENWCPQFQWMVIVFLNGLWISHGSPYWRSDLFSKALEVWVLGFLFFLKKDVVPLYSTWFPTSFFSLKGCHCAEFCHLGNGPIARPLGWNHRAIGPRLFSHRTWPLPNWRT